jgi:ferredoxin-NADP reductase
MNFFAKLYRRPVDLLDSLLDKITSYRLVLYFLLAILCWSIIGTFGHHIPGSWHSIALSATVLVIVCRLSGEFFSRVLNIARNNESDYITALILALIMNPATDFHSFAVLAGAGFAAITSKYLLTINRRHIFNPAAAGAFVSGLMFSHYASWWVGTATLAPLVFVGGILIMRKMKRFVMVAVFMLVYLAILHHQFDGAPPLHTLWLSLSGSAVMFFAYIMLLEPLTTPDRIHNYVPYSVLVAVLYSVNRLHVSPEEALLIGNVLAYALERGKRLELALTNVGRQAEGIYSFAFSHHGLVDFKPGQYMEWTLPLAQTDSRGNRRYLTLSSSPTENNLAFTVRLPKEASHFKRALATFKPGDKILASHLGGSFTLPTNQQQKLAFLAGGIGITPFRSMVKYLLDKQQHRDVNLLYFASSPQQFAFTDLFQQARHVGVASHFVDTSKTPLNKNLLATTVPDYKERLFYISGPYNYVKAARESLLDLGVGPTSIRSDYFPGYG